MYNSSEKKIMKEPKSSPDCKMLQFKDQCTSVHHQVLWLPTAHPSVCVCACVYMRVCVIVLDKNGVL